MAQPDYSGSSMLALYPHPADAQALAIDSGLDPADMHVTIAYTGDAAAVPRKALRRAARKLAAGRSLIPATISGHARFTGGDQDAIVALVDSPHIDRLRQAAVKECSKRGIPLPSEHGFTSHMTLGYVDKDAPDPVGRLNPRKVAFRAVTASHGDNRKAYPLDDIMETAAVNAYAEGFVISGGPMTEQVRAGCTAAVWSALEHADDPGILEATLEIGSLEGIWAKFFHRREQLTVAQTALIVAILKKIVAGLPVVRLVDQLRAELGATAFAAGYLKQLTGHAASGLLAGIYAHEEHNGLQDAVENALRAAAAEGQAGALALNASKHNVPGFDFDAAYQAIFDRLAQMPDWAMMAQDWVQRLIGGAGRDIGNLLAQLFADGATKQEMVDAVVAALNPADSSVALGRAVSAFMSQAMATAMSQASLDLYASEGAAEAFFVTAGAGACVLCEDIESQNPYAPTDCPVPGSDTHPFCVPGDVLVSAPSGISAGYRRWYDGDLVVIHTASGKELPVTPNHPIATPEGWVAAGDLKVGQHVLSHSGDVERMRRVGPDDQLVPARISDVLDALREASSVPTVCVPAAAEQFHGDGLGGDVDVVFADGLLKDHGYSECLGDGALVLGGMTQQSFSCDRAPGELILGEFHPTHCVVGGSSEPAALLGTGAGHPGEHRRAASSRLNTGLDESVPDDISLYPEGDSESQFALASQVASGDRICVDGHSFRAAKLMRSADPDASGFKPSADRGATDLVDVPDVIERLTLGITADEIVNIKRSRLRGHVYNLQTGSGWFFANQIVSHNCRCVTTVQDPAPFKALAALID